MKPVTILILLTITCVAGCSTYRPSKANCFDFDTVTRNDRGMALLLADTSHPQERISTKSKRCTFTPIGYQEQPTNE